VVVKVVLHDCSIVRLCDEDSIIAGRNGGIYLQHREA
jgi:hypothetical protein